jgi:hypothetical protein
VSANQSADGGSSQLSGSEQATAFRLYIAHATPNSVRAQRNLHAALEMLQLAGGGYSLEVIDVFVDGKRAIRDGVIVTPTLIVSRGHNQHTIVGDLTHSEELAAVLKAYAD